MAWGWLLGATGLMVVAVCVACETGGDSGGPSGGGQAGASGAVSGGNGGGGSTGGTGGAAGEVGGGGQPAGPIAVASDLGNPTRIALSANSIYVVAYDFNNQSHGLLKIPKAGGATEWLVKVDQDIRDLALDATSIYYTTPTAQGCVFSLLQGGGTPSSLSSNVCGRHIAVQDGNLFWTADTSVAKATLSGADLTVIAQDFASSFDMYGFAVDASGVYWGNKKWQIMKTTLSGGTPVELATATGTAQALAIAGGNVYFTIGASGSEGKVASVPIQGGPVTVLAVGQTDPTTIAADGKSLYWVNRGWGKMDGAIMKLTPGGSPTAIAQGLATPEDLALDASHVYWTDQDGPLGRVMKAAK
ncbi:MAG: DUF5050 domain-containing protein [Myxococcales bacterium]|nr:DUF5050 domain-containing protein [Myxococcales bacterium]